MGRVLKELGSLITRYTPNNTGWTYGDRLCCSNSITPA